MAQSVKLADLNIFSAWFFIPQTLAMGWVAFVGRLILELFGTVTPEAAIPGRIAGAIILLCVIYVLRLLMGHALPIIGNPGGNGYKLGHRLIFAANLLAAILFIFQLGWHYLPSASVTLVLASFSEAFGYWVMALWAVGFSFIYQSTQSVVPPAA